MSVRNTECFMSYEIEIINALSILNGYGLRSISVDKTFFDALFSMCNPSDRDISKYIAGADYLKVLRFSFNGIEINLDNNLRIEL